MNNIFPKPRMVWFGTAILDRAVRVLLCFNAKDEETDDDNIPLIMLYKRRHTSKNKVFKKQKNKISQ